MVIGRVDISLDGESFLSFQPSGFFMLTRGMMSVLSSLFFFCLGSGAGTCLVSDEIKTLGRTSTQTFLVLLNVEAAKQHDGLGSVDATEDLVGRFDVGTVAIDEYLCVFRLSVIRMQELTRHRCA